MTAGLKAVASASLKFGRSSGLGSPVIIAFTFLAAGLSSGFTNQYSSLELAASNGADEPKESASGIETAEATNFLLVILSMR
ncbi:hypothetical protein D3C84_998780 [compost metagenome]